MATAGPNPALKIGFVDGWFVLNSMLAISPEGGVCARMINKTGGASVKGTLVQPASVANGFSLCTVGDPDIIGIVYDEGIAADGQCWVVTSGIADVFFVGNTTIRYLARMCASGDSGAANGKAIAETAPTSPFATDKHFQEIGHVIEARTGAGLAKCVVHFN